MEKGEMMSESDQSKKRARYESVFVVNESYIGVKNLSDIFADLLYSAYCKSESGCGDSGADDMKNHYDYPPIISDQSHYGNSALI